VELVYKPGHRWSEPAEFVIYGLNDGKKGATNLLWKSSYRLRSNSHDGPLNYVALLPTIEKIGSFVRSPR
jgi:hypothetical protein